MDITKGSEPSVWTEDLLEDTIRRADAGLALLRERRWVPSDNSRGGSWVPVNPPATVAKTSVAA